MANPVNSAPFQFSKDIEQLSKATNKIIMNLPGVVALTAFTHEKEYPIPGLELGVAYIAINVTFGNDTAVKIFLQNKHLLKKANDSYCVIQINKDHYPVVIYTNSRTFG